MVSHARHSPSASGSFLLLVASCMPPGTQRQHALSQAVDRDIDAATLLQLAHWHRVEPLLACAVTEAGVILPAPASEKLQRRARDARLTTLRNIAEEARLAGAAGNSGLDLLFIKGATVGHLAQVDPTAKRSWDIDILVAPDDLRRACAFLDAQGYVLHLPAGVGTGPQRERWLAGNRESLWRHPARRTAVELHTALCESPAMLPGVGMASPRQQVTLAGQAVPTLATAELFAYLTVHGATHGWARLKWLADVAGLIAMGDIPVQELHDAAVRLGAGHCSGVALILCRELFDLPLPEALERRLRADRGVMRLVRHSRAAIEGDGSPDRHLSADSFGEIVASLRLQYWLAPGVAYRLRTFWSQWTRPYAPSLAHIPGPLLPLAMIAWLPGRLLTRRWRRT